MSIDDYLPGEMERVQRERQADEEMNLPLQRAVAEFLPIGKKLYRDAQEHGAPIYNGSDPKNQQTYMIDPYPDGVDSNTAKLHLHPTGHVLDSPTDENRSLAAVVALRRMIDNDRQEGVVFHNGTMYWKGRKHRSIDEAAPLVRVVARDLARKIAEIKISPA